MAFHIKDELADEFFRAVTSLSDVDECRNFLEDLCTIKELQAMIQRYHVAKLLSQGMVYADIVAQTGASTATISRVNRSLAYGSDGYKRVFERMGK